MTKIMRLRLYTLIVVAMLIPTIIFTAFLIPNLEMMVRLMIASFSFMFIGLGGSCLMILLKGDKYDNEEIDKRIAKLDEIGEKLDKFGDKKENKK